MKGGAINYEGKWPQMSDIIFAGNEAPYGSNIASYGSKLLLKLDGSEET